ncbi:amidohydrolase family protein [Paraconexibacter sp.]|uniref:amidohydrolase family protein n=1 Tax=Paraconexibacter sp. TaxID=2949640 RepID=UPI0035616934
MLIPGAPQDDDILELRARHVAQVLPPDAPWFDAHTHIGQHDPDGLTATPQELLAGLDRAGHAQALVFPMHEPAGYATANAEVRAVCAASSGRLRSLVRIDPDHPDALDEARLGLDEGAVGIKLHPRSDAFLLPHPVVDQLAALLARAGGGILLFHAGRGIPALGPSAVAIAERHPEVRLILAHTGVSDLGLVAEPASRLPNLCFDTAWWQIDDMLQMYATIPPGQIHYASDMPYGGGVFASLAMVRCAVQAGLGAEAIAAIAGGQLQRVLDGHPPLDLGPAPGAVVLEDDRPVVARLASRRAISYLGIATLSSFHGGPVDEPLSLARLACATDTADPVLALVDELAATAQRRIAAAEPPVPGAPPPLPGHAPGIAALLAAGVVAGTPRAGG